MTFKAKYNNFLSENYWILHTAPEITVTANKNYIDNICGIIFCVPIKQMMTNFRKGSSQKRVQHYIWFALTTDFLKIGRKKNCMCRCALTTFLMIFLYTIFKTNENWVKLQSLLSSNFGHRSISDYNKSDHYPPLNLSKIVGTGIMWRLRIEFHL